MTLGRVVAGIVTAVTLASVGALSQLPMGDGSEEALVRLSWRAPVLRVEECRTLTREELDRIAPHMRRSEECTGYTADYEVRVTIAGGEERVDTVAPSGARRDRPVYVFLDVPVAPGAHDVTVAFTALVPGDAEVGDVPRTVQWSGTLRLEPRQIGLVTLAADGRSLEARR